MKYRKKPVVIEAFRFQIDKAMPDWFNEKRITNEIITHNDGTVEIKTLEGVMKANKGDYIIQGVNGEIYPCKPDIFEKTYEEVVERGGNEMKKQYNVTIREIYPCNFNCNDVWYQDIQIHWSCEHIGYGVLTIRINKDNKYEFDTEDMGLEFTKAVLKAYNSYLLKKAKDYFTAEHITSEAPSELEKLEKEKENKHQKEI